MEKVYVYTNCCWERARQARWFICSACHWGGTTAIRLAPPPEDAPRYCPRCLAEVRPKAMRFLRLVIERGGVKYPRCTAPDRAGWQCRRRGAEQVPAGGELWRCAEHVSQGVV